MECYLEKLIIMKIADIINQAYTMPLTSPVCSKGPFIFKNREFFNIIYRTDAEKLRKVVPEPLEIDTKNPLVTYEFIRMPDSTGFGDYTESGQAIPVIYNGEKGTYVHAMYLDDHAPTAGGREIWGFPKKIAAPRLEVDKDVLMGTLHYGKILVATGTMGYKFDTLNTKEIANAFTRPNFLLKIIPHVDGRTPRVLELVKYYCENVTIKGAWTGPAALQLFAHALAPVTDLPVLEVISAQHILTDMTLGMGHVVYDYLSQR